DNVDFERILLAKRTLERIRTIPRLFAPAKSPAVTKLIQEYITTLDTLYGGIAKVSGGKIIADTSKSALYTYSLSRCPSVDLQIVHLVRDSRAVAYSYRRRKANPAATTGKGYLGEVNPGRIAMEWSAQHLLMSMLKPSGDRYVFLRYEDVVKDPKAALMRICSLVGDTSPNLDFLNEEEIPIGRHHIVFGNPDRFQKTIKIRIDDEWRKKMKPGHRAVVTVLTAPLLLRYGYLGKRTLA
ncbi:MAG TPA: sulfotransferase domain-containing protein, partial [Capsulimonadaceae bacterium]|nr:sulfotransferase domain-containing protein [Capsulimonadaceae bacterium]